MAFILLVTYRPNAGMYSPIITKTSKPTKTAKPPKNDEIAQKDNRNQER